MTVALPSTPASYFHLLRRHANDGIERPLVVFTPKSMLRNKAAVSPVWTSPTRSSSPCSTTRPSPMPRPTGRRSGAWSWSAASSTTNWPRREADGRDDIAIVRIEQLYRCPIGACG